MSTSRTDTDPSPQPPWQRLTDRFVRYASEPDDLPELKLRKVLGVAVYSIGLLVWLVYGAIWFSFGARLAGQVCMVVACSVALCFAGHVRLRNYTLLIVLLGLIHQLGFLGVHFGLGGFRSSPYILVYILLIPLLAPFVDEARNTKYWVAGTAVLVLIAGVGERFVAPVGYLPPGTQTLLTVSILLGFALFALVPALIYGQRTRAINQQLAEAREAQLAQKAEHLAQTQSALERQTATAEILKVIAGSPSDVQPVLDAIVHSAARLFGRKTALRTIEGDGLRRRARSYDAAADEFHGPEVVPIDRHSVSGRAVVEGRAVQVADNRAPGSDIFFKSQTRELSFRSIASAPLMREGVAIGVISMSSPQPGALSDAQMELLQTFADQAVIAIENARLFNETKEALERQTATAEVLQVISSSVSDAQPVLEKILDSCTHLFDVATATVMLVGEDGLLHLSATRTVSREGAPADWTDADVTAAAERGRAVFPMPLAGTGTAAAIACGKVLNFPDVLNGTDVPRGVRAAALAMGINYSQMMAPLMQGTRGLGAIALARSALGGFTDREQALLKSFADQAVIAIQNARLFRETNEALERQTATAEILKVIARSPSDVQPVFDAIARSSNQLLGGWSTMVARIEDDALQLVAFTSTTPEGDAALKASFPIALATYPFGAAIRRGETVPIVDTELLDGDLSGMRELARARGFRSLLFCPLVREGQSVGMISVTRREPGPFAPHQVALLQTFADQAVIAIENVRLFNETQEALERQTATAGVLQVISNSMADAQPVFQAIVQACQRLFVGQSVILSRLRDDGQVEHAAVAVVGTTEEEARSFLDRGFPRPLSQSYQAYPIRQQRVVHYPDMLHGPGVPEGMR
nr:GAF domain-containing protein [Burkholderiaceae bacterium]